MDKITIENFSKDNRTKIIGNTMYRICKNEDSDIWYIYKQHNDGANFSQTKLQYNKDLQTVIDVFNNIDGE